MIINNTFITAVPFMHFPHIDGCLNARAETATGCVNKKAVSTWRAKTQKNNGHKTFNIKHEILNTNGVACLTDGLIPGAHTENAFNYQGALR